MSDARDLLAAEYALGTLDTGERDAAARLRADDPAFDRLVTDWENRLSPLADGLASETPPADLWPRIVAGIEDRSSLRVSDNVAALRRSVRSWRMATFATSALAASLALFALDRDVLRPPPSQAAYVAAVNRGGDMPALIVRVDLANHSVTVRPVEAETPSDKSLQLWYVASGKPPMSMGLVGKDRDRMPMPSGMEMKNGMFAVSVEPMGGSPTGAPTGPIVYKGMLVAE